MSGFYSLLLSSFAPLLCYNLSMSSLIQLLSVLGIQLLLLSPTAAQSSSYSYSYEYGKFSSSTVPKKLTPNSALTNGDQYGTAVSIWKDSAIVSSTKLVAMTDGSVGSGGVVNLFYRQSGPREWKDSGLEFVTPYGLDGFGKSIAIWDSTIAVGAPLLNMVHVYSGTNYQSWDELTAREAGENDYFGHSVAIVHGSGHYSSSGAVVVGAYGHSENKEHQHTGSVFVFVRDSSYDWKVVANLQPARVQQGGYFGYSVAAYGNVVVVGAPGSESAYVFSMEGHYRECPHEGHMPEDCESQHHHLRRRSLQGGEGGDHEREDREREEREHEHFYYTEWEYEEELEVQGGQGEELGFGTSVAVYNDTTLTVAIGAIYDYQTSASHLTGSVYVISQIDANDAISSWHPTDYFPEHEHHRALQGAPDDKHNDMRYWPIKLSAYTSDKLDKYWMLETTIYGTTAGEKFGHAIAVEYSNLAIGNHPEALGVGRVEIHSRGTASAAPVNSPIYQGPLYKTIWSKTTDLTDVYGDVNDMFGGALSLFRTTLIVGSYLTGFSSSNNAIGTGAAYAYDTVIVTATLVEEEETTTAVPVVDDGLTAFMKSMTVLSFSFIVALFSSVCGFVAYKVTMRKVNDGSFDSFYNLLGWSRVKKGPSLSDIDSSVTSQHDMLSRSSTSNVSTHSSNSGFQGGPGRFSEGAPGQHQRQPPPSPGQTRGQGASRQISLQELGAGGRGGNRPVPHPHGGAGGPSSYGARPTQSYAPTHHSRGPPSNTRTAYASRPGVKNNMSGL